MPYVEHKLTALMITDPEQAKAEILTAFTNARAHMTNAASALGVTTSTLERWITKLGLRNKIDAIRDKAKKDGWWHGNGGGRPPLKTSGRKKKRAA